MIPFSPETISSSAKKCAFSADGRYFAVALSSSPYIAIYKKSNGVYTKLNNPNTLPAGVAFGCSFSADGVYLAVAHANSPYITIYKRTGDTFAKLANPASLPTAT
ncbi:MAG: WD40 repeat domain-containing protein, partial [Christensenellaceae bacterium]|nr:WD40 repeat domain-containing protein [Christensenellaceae bacterium]